MSNQDSDHEIRRSVWDRLMAPSSQGTSSQETVLPTQQGIRYLQKSIQSNLVQILNSHVHFTLWTPALDELEESLVNYGIPNYTGANMEAEMDQEQMRRALKQAICTFEPRLTQVEVEIVKGSTDVKHLIHFRIEAEIANLSHSVPIAFRSDLDPLVRKIAVAVSNR